MITVVSVQLLRLPSETMTFVGLFIIAVGSGGMRSPQTLDLFFARNYTDSQRTYKMLWNDALLSCRLRIISAFDHLIGRFCS